MEIRGLAYEVYPGDEFGYYTFEFRGKGAPAWSFLQRFEEPVTTDGVLGIWDTSSLPAGAYTFRVTVVSKSGAYAEPCEVEVTIKH